MEAPQQHSKVSSTRQGVEVDGDMMSTATFWLLVFCHRRHLRQCGVCGRARILWAVTLS